MCRRGVGPGYEFANGDVEIRWKSKDGPVLKTVKGPAFSERVAIPSDRPGVYTVVAVGYEANPLLRQVAGQTSAAFEITGPPTVTAVDPGSGPASGGTPVTITGTGFTGESAVRFGDVTASTVTPQSTTEISAVSPGHQAGTVNVTVTTQNGASAVGTPSRFTFLPAESPFLPGNAFQPGPVGPGNPGDPAIGRCLAASSVRVGPRGIGGAAIGQRQEQVIRRLGPPARRVRGTLRYCATDGRRLHVAFSGTRESGSSGRAIVRLVAVTGRGQLVAGVSRGDSVRRLGGAYRGVRRLGADLFVKWRPRPILLRTSRGRVRSVAVVDRRLLRNRSALASYLRRAGI